MAKPNRKDATRPVELLAIAAGLSLFLGLVVFMATRELVLALIFTGVTFIIALVILAMLVLAIRPSGDEKLDIDEQDRSGH